MNALTSVFWGLALPLVDNHLATHGYVRGVVLMGTKLVHMGTPLVLIGTRLVLLGTNYHSFSAASCLYTSGCSGLSNDVALRLLPKILTLKHPW